MGQSGPDSGSVSNDRRMGRGGKVWVDGKKYKFVLRHRMASFFLSLVFFPTSIVATVSLAASGEGVRGGVGRRLNNAWRRFAGPQISSSARSPQEASTPLPRRYQIPRPFLHHPFSSLPTHLAVLSRTQELTFIILVKIGDRFCHFKMAGFSDAVDNFQSYYQLLLALIKAGEL